MEKLKSVVPESLKLRIAESTPDTLPSACSSLLDFFHQLPQFQQFVDDLTDVETALCRKDRDGAMESKREGNECFVNGDYSKALDFYSRALRVAPTDADDMGKNLVGVLYVNRASALNKMKLLVECLRDCNRALVISPRYAKAWYRRGKVNVSLENYEDAERDFGVALYLEVSPSGKKQIENELKLLSAQCKGTNTSLDETNEKKSVTFDEPQEVKLQCVSTPTKGRGMVSLTDIPEASLMHTEEPYAAIILKHCRETHCHFCFNELPADTVPCSSCSIPLYCCEECRVQAGGEQFGNDLKNYGIDLPGDLEKYIADVTLANVSWSYPENIAEHRHECRGVHWPAVLPSEIVLAGRVLVKSIEQQRQFCAVSRLTWNLDLCHNYIELHPERKLELQIYSIILLYCIQHCRGSEIPIDGVAVSTCVILLCQIGLNAMAIVRMKSLDVDQRLDQASTFYSVGDVSKSTMEQIRVGQAIYTAGSLFNHSCQPNINVYFLSRTLYVRSTEFVAGGCPLELSYGPQVGQWDYKDRQRFLEDHYFFRCQCSGCSELNLSDLVLNAFRCVKQSCSGIVLANSVTKYEKQKLSHVFDVSRLSTIDSLVPNMQAVKFKNDDVNEVASKIFQQMDPSNQLEPGHCLKCGSPCNLEAYDETVNKAGIYIKRLVDAIVSNEVSRNTLSDTLKALGQLRSTLHAYNKRLAEVEDNLAQAYFLFEELECARDHCKASIKILEKLYDPNHIVIGNELVKLTSIQLPLGDVSTSDSIKRATAIFLRYYGSHMDIIFPHLQSLMEEACKLVR